MASNGGKVQFGVQFKVDKSGLNQMKKSLQEVVKAADNMKAGNQLKGKFDQAAESAKKLSNILDQAWNSKLGQLNLDKVDAGIKNTYGDVNKLRTSLQGAGHVGSTAFAKVTSDILNTNNQLLRSSKLLDNMADTMAKTVRYGIASSIFNRITGSIQQAYYYAKDLDRSLTDIRIVTGDSADQMERFAKSANTAAKDLGRSTLDYTKAALSYYQQGLGDEEVAARTEATLKAQNITGIGSEMADYLTAVWNGFNAGAEDAQLYVDKLAAVADSTASNMGQLATAISKVASTANNVGVTADQLNGQIATVIATTRQAPEAVGTAFKTIFARINDIKAGTEDAQISLGNYSGKMADLGINVLDATGHLRDTGQVIEQIGSKWQNMSREQQIYLAQTMAGQRQYNNLIALFDNWDRYIQSVNTSLQAQGTLNEKNDRYMESLGAHLQQLGTEAERTYDVMFDTDGFKSLVDVAEDLLSIFNDFIKGIGGGATALINLGTIGANVFNKQLTEGLLRFKDNLKTLNINKVAEKLKNQFAANILSQRKAAGDYNTVDEEVRVKAAQKQAEIYQKIYSVRQGLTKESAEEFVNLQKKAGQLTVQVETLSNYKNLAEQIGFTEQNTVQYIQQNTLAKQQNLDLTNKNLIAVQESIKNHVRLSDAQIQQLNTLNQEVDIRGYLTAEEQKAYDQALKNINSGKGYLKDRQIIEEALLRAEQNQSNQIQKQNTLLELKKAIERGDLETAKALLLETEKRTNELQKQASVVKNTQNGMSYFMYAVQGITTLAGAFGQAMKQGATAADKATAAVSAMQGGFSSIGGIIGTFFGGPMGGMIGSSLGGVASTILSIIPGFKDGLEDLFSTVNEKIESAENKFKQTIDKATDASDKKKNLQNVADEFENLSRKAGQYGQNLASMTAEQQQRYKSIVDDIVELNPDIVLGYNDQGQAIINNNTALQDTLDLLDQEYEKQMAVAYGAEQIAKKTSALEQAQELKNSAEADLSNEEGYNNKLFSDNFNFAVKNLKSFGIIGGTQETPFMLDTQNKNSALDKIIDDLKNVYNLGPVADKLEEIRGNYIEQLKAAEGDVGLIQQATRDFETKINTVLGPGNVFAQDFEYLFPEEVKQILNNFTDNLSNGAIKEAYEKSNQVRDQLEAAGQYASTQFQTALQSYKKSIIGAIVWNPQLNDDYTDIKNNFGDLWNDNIATMISQVIDQAVKDFDYDKYFADGGTVEGLQKTVAEAVNEKLKQTFSNLNKYSLTDAQDSLNNFIIESLEGLSPEEYQKKLLEIYNKFLDKNQNLKNMLNSNNQEDNNIAITILNALFSGVGGKVQEVVNEKTGQTQRVLVSALSQARTGIENAIRNSASGQYGRSDASTLTDWLFSTYNDQEILQIFDAIQNGTLKLDSSAGNLLTFTKAVQDYMSTAEQSSDGTELLLQNFDKVASAIQKLQNDKELSYKDKLNLKEYLGLTDQQVEDANYVLDNFKQKILSLPEGLERYEGLSKVITDFKTLEQYKEQLKPGEEEALWQDIFDTELKNLNINEQALAAYAQARHLAFNNEDNKQAALDLYKAQKSWDELGSKVQSAKEKLKDYTNAEEAVKDTQALSYLEQLQTILNNLGLDVDYQWIIDNLMKIGQAAQGDLPQLDQLQDKIESMSNQQSSADTYKDMSSYSTNLTGAYEALSSGQSMTEEQSTALNDLIAKNEKLAELSRQQGIASKDFLSILQQIVQATEQEAIAQGKIAIEQLKVKEDALRTSIDSHREDIQGPKDAEILAEKQKELNETISNRLAIEAQISAEYQKQADNAQTIDQLQSANLMGMDDDTFEKNLDTVAGRQAQSLGLDADQVLDYASALQDLADVSEDLDDNLDQNRDSALQVAIAGKRLSRGIQDLADHFDQYNEKLNSDNMEEYADAMGSLKDAMGDILNIDGNALSGQFITNNLENMKLAAEGDIEAIDRLRAAAAKDIIQNCEVYLNGDDQVRNNLDALNSLITDFASQDIEIGANIDDTDFINKCNQLVADANMTEQQIQSYFNSLGFNPKITYETSTSEPVVTTTQGEVVLFDKLTVPYSMTSSSVTDVKVPRIESLTKTGGGAHSGAVTHTPTSSGGKSGGGKGGGGKGKGGKGKGGKGNKGNKNKDLNEDKVQPKSDPYHKVNKQLETLDDNLKKITDDREKLTGKNYINNLQQQLEVMKKQVKVQREKMNIARTQRTQAKNFLSKYGAQYNNDGNLTNYDSILSKAASAYNKKVDEYNKYTVVDDSKAWDKISKGKSKKWKTDYLKKHKDAEYNISQSFADNMKAGLESAKKTYEKVQDMIDQYEEAEGIVDAFDEKAKDVAERQIEIKIETFTLKINAKLDKASLEQSWNQFLKDIQQDGGLNDVFEDASMNKKNISSITSRVDTNLQAVKDINRQIQTIRQGGESTLFGKEWIDSNGQHQYVTDEASAYEYLKTKVEDLQKSYKELKTARDAIKQDALKSIEQVADAYDKVNDELEFQNDLLKHQQKLIKLTQGEKAFKALDKQYRKSLNNQKQQAAQAREESQYWYNKMNTIADKNSELYQSYYNNYKQAVQNLNDATQNELQILSDLYKNKVNQIIDDWEQKITNGIGLDAISKQWDYVKERSEEVLDDVNRNYQISAFNIAGEEYLQQAEGNLKAQQAIKKVLAEQNQFLKQKQNITQYDIDRANLLLQIEAKRAQLEDANSAKTKLRLRRDSQGNYSYQYVAEDTGVAKAKKQLEELQNELWNFTKNGVQQAQDNVLDAVQSFEQELADIWDKQYQSDEKRQQALDALYAKYSDKISRYVTEIQQRGGQLTDLGTDLLPLLTGASSEYFQGLTPEEQAEYVDKLSGGILTGGGIQAMLNNFLSSGGFDAWFKELNTKFEANKSQWVAESTAATDNETDVNAQAQAASQSAKIVAQTNLNTAKSFLNQTVEIYNNVCDAVSALTTQYNQLGDAIKDLAKEGEGLSTLYSWYDEQAEAASGKTTQLVNATAAQNEAAQNEAIIISNSKNKLASYTDQWSQAVDKGNTYSKKIWPQIMASKAFYDDNLLTKAIKDINESNPLLNILNNLGDYSNYINSGMLNKIKDAFTFTQAEVRMLDPNQVRQAYQQSVKIAASFPNVRSEEEIKNALNSMITKASQYIHNDKYTIK